MKQTITVLIRMFNNQDTIETALQSVINQTLPSSKYCILVVDDGSTDDSIKLVQKYPEVQIFQTGREGAVGALNRGLEVVKTQYVIYLDSDDWFEPTILETMYERFKQEPDTGFVYSDYYEISNSSKVTISIHENIFNTIAAGIMFSTHLLRTHEFYDESLVFAEYDLLIRLLPKTNRYYIPKPLYNYVRHQRSISADKSFEQIGREQLFEKYGKHFPIREY